ncbi:MAG: hypothetical protein KAJ75_07530 [Alphaproteobacteria bacterium]|nr:hypothetical protein [Alphaproteobacteria bacterium]
MYDRLEKVKGLVTDETLIMNKIEELAPVKKLQQTRMNLFKELRGVAKTENIALILDVEKYILITDLTHHANSKSMVSSLNKSLTELILTENLLQVVAKPESYKSIDMAHQKKENRKKGLPYDEARQFFASHRQRMDNNSRSRLNDNEKQILNQRKNNIRTAEKLYIVQQEKTLGIATTKDKEISISL